MTNIKVFINTEKNIVGVEVSGHAGYGDSGEDIVCAGISALSYTLLNSLEGICKIKTKSKVKDGYIKCMLPDNLDSNKFLESQIILKSIILGYENLKKTYKSYVKVVIEEV